MRGNAVPPVCCYLSARNTCSGPPTKKRGEQNDSDLVGRGALKRLITIVYDDRHFVTAEPYVDVHPQPRTLEQGGFRW